MLPDSATIQSTIRKAVAAVTGVVLALVLLTALLITGFYLLVNAATLALAPIVGEPGAMAITGVVCLCLLALFFYRLTRPARTFRDSEKNQSGSGSGSPIGVLRSLITRNPLEAAALAFAFGVAEQSDPRLKNLLFQGGMVLMRQSAGSSDPETGDSEGAPAPSTAKAPAE
ncbi:hypothetical protein SAMN05216369_0821 [Marinobacter antarcticus]|uniref:Holin-X, holin superfamily III n=1 Tax=Marinobacter antarcticus TaxID=564117 RepID=A0A1M6QBS9_9GAMM|nr:hypothetical protein [Marinobacter antarcticus]SHK17739.1 hypothetical protein SAMN05216369_0821 [Marinobacter antarcticus]